MKKKSRKRSFKIRPIPVSATSPHDGTVLPFPGGARPADTFAPPPPVDPDLERLVLEVAGQFASAALGELRLQILSGVSGEKQTVSIQILEQCTAPSVVAAIDRFTAVMRVSSKLDEINRLSLTDSLASFDVWVKGPFAAALADVDDAIARSGIRAIELPEESRALATMSFSPMSAKFAIPTTVPLLSSADFLNALGIETVRAGYADMQSWPQVRRSKGLNGLESVHGFVIDIDAKYDDVVGTLRRLSVPLANLIWPTLCGHKLAYFFSEAIEPDVVELIAKWTTLSLPGSDPGSWNLAQGQHLATCIKTRGDEQVPIPYQTMLLNPRPFAVSDFPVHTLPLSLRRVWGSRGACSPDEREVVERYLEDLGIPAPEERGTSHLYSRCLLVEQHDTPKTYTDRNTDGSITVRCLGHHEGEGPKNWSESALHVLATGAAPSSAPDVDPIADVSATWGGLRYLESSLTEAWAEDPFAKQKVPAAIDLWLYVKAHAEAAAIGRRAKGMFGSAAGEGEIAVPPISQVLDVYRARTAPFIGMTAARVFFDEGTQEIQIFDGEHGSHALRVRSETLSSKTHAGVWRSTSAFALLPELEKVDDDEKNDGGNDAANDDALAGGVRYSAGFDQRYASAWALALSGNREALRALGLPRVNKYDFPVGFSKTRWWVDEETRNIRGIIVPQLKAHDPTFDAREHFLNWLREDHFPVVSENDALRFLMALTLPLLRQLAPGLTGAAWFVGPPGGGKEFVQSLLGDIHLHALVHPPLLATAEMSVKDDLQMERSFHDNLSVLYIRSTEIKKRPKLVEPFIRFTAARFIPVKGLQKAERHIPNTFTFLADSAEPMPMRREIERRVFLINVPEIDPRVNLGVLRMKILGKAPDLIASLLRLVATKDENSFLTQGDLGGRPLLQVGAARLLGAELDKIEGRDMDDIFEAFAFFIEMNAASAEGKSEMDKSIERKKDGEEAKRLPHYRFSFIREVMTDKYIDTGNGKEPRGYVGLFAEFKDIEALRITLDREIGYSPAIKGGKPYIPVQVGEKHYAFKIVRSNRNILFCDELLFCTTMGIDALTPEVREKMRAGASSATEAPAQPDHPDTNEPAPKNSGYNMED